MHMRKGEKMKIKHISILLIVSLFIVFSLSAVPAFGSSAEPQKKLDRPDVALMSYGSKMLVEWGKIKDADKYEVSYKLVSADKWKTKKVSGTTFSVKAIAGEKYKVRVRALNEKGKGAWSYVRIITMKKGYSGSNSKYIILGWKGRFSEGMLKKTEKVYESNYRSMEVKNEKASRMINLNIGKYDSCKIKNIYTAGLGKGINDKRIKEKVYDQRYDIKKGIFSFDASWWYEKKSGEYSSDIAYLFELKKKGVSTYKYMRIHYEPAKSDPQSMTLEFIDSSRICHNGRGDYIKSYLNGSKRKLSFDGNDYTVTYTNSRHVYKNTYDTDYYKRKNITIGFNEKTGGVTYFSKTVRSPKGNETINSLKPQAIKFASKYLDPNKYDLEMEEVDDLFIYTFTRDICETETSAVLTLMYNSKGEIEVFSENNNDVIDDMVGDFGEDKLNDIVSKLRSDNVRSLVIDKFNKKYSKGTNTVIVNETIVALRNGEPAIIYHVNSEERFPLKDDIMVKRTNREDILVSFD